MKRKYIYTGLSKHGLETGKVYTGVRDGCIVELYVQPDYLVQVELWQVIETRTD